MARFIKILLISLILIDIVLILRLLIGDNTVSLLDPKGAIGVQQRDVALLATGIMLLIVAPVVFFIFFFAWRYRDGNKKAQYSPHHRSRTSTQLVWWFVPTVIIVILSVINWNSTHALDPYKPLDSDKEPLVIQVVALQWKWLFLYPEQGIATINYIQFPEDTPIQFEITADGPMSSFWIPSLGGQMYAMTGMGTTLHLIADEQGDFNGMSAEINGRGFSGMKFIARASSTEEFEDWVQLVKESPNQLDRTQYDSLVTPTENNPKAYYVLTEKDLYNEVIRKFMSPGKSDHHTMSEMEGMEH